jgi:hypothetical protein
MRGVAWLVMVMPITAIAADNPKVRQAFEKLDVALAQEAANLLKKNKPQEAQEVLGIQKNIADNYATLNDPGKCESMRKAMFVRQMIGKWDRPTFPRTYTIRAQGPELFLTELDPNGAVTNKGLIVVHSENMAKVKLDSGHEWTILHASGDRLAIEEIFGGTNISNDGIVFRRLSR